VSGLVGEVVRDADALARLSPDWLALWRRSGAGPFQAPAWLVPWWRHFRPGELAVAAVRDPAGRLVGLAPFYIEEGRHGRRLLPLGISVSDTLDVLLDPDVPAAGPALVACLSSERWDVWELEELPPDAAALALSPPAGAAEESFAASACPVLSLCGANRLEDVVPPARMQNLRTARNRAERRGTAIDGVATEAIGAFVQDLVRLHAARWAGRGEPGLFADPRFSSFLREALPRLADLGLVQASTLRLDGLAIGAYLGFRHAGRAAYYLGGFDPDHAFVSPGALLIGHAIEQAIAGGAEAFDFLRGREPYKYAWGAVDRWNRHRRFRRASHV